MFEDASGPKPAHLLALSLFHGDVRMYGEAMTRGWFRRNVYIDIGAGPGGGER